MSTLYLCVSLNWDKLVSAFIVSAGAQTLVVALAQGLYHSKGSTRPWIPLAATVRLSPYCSGSNRFLREEYIAEFNRRFQTPAAQKGSAFTPCRRRDLDLIFSLQFERTVNRDNTISFEKLNLQIEKVNWRRTLAGCSVMVHQHLDRTLSITYGPQRLGHYTGQGTSILKTSTAEKVVEKTFRGKVKKPTFPPRLEIPQTARDSHFPTTSATAGL